MTPPSTRHSEGRVAAEQSPTADHPRHRDETGKRTAVLISFADWGEAWEDIQDILVLEARRSKPTVSWEDAKKAMAIQDAAAETVHD